MCKKRFVVLTTLGFLSVAMIVCAGMLSRAASPAPGSSGYHLIKTVSVPGDEGWDYLNVDAATRRVYISHGSHVVVMNADTYAVEGDIPDTAGVHGIALAPDLGRGFVSAGRANTAVIFDIKSLKTLGTAKTDANPDAIVYDSVTKRVFALNGRGQNTTAINAADGTVAGTLALGGKPEFAVADGKGSIFVNIEDKSELVEFDAQKLTETHRWPLAPCKSPSGLAMDLKTRRLFSVCDEKVMAVVNADTGKVIATPEICQGPDASAFDPATDYAFASCGDGNLIVIHEDSPDKFTVVENVPTKRSARTMGLDLKTHNIFLSSAEFDPPAPGERRGKMKPGSFAILVVGK
ncbi:MAG TPA: YncE family protein [Candidatus Acidoferrum sp.]|nr:YncE family protein [Candidatus Acidoferrum sp.]